MSWQEHEVSESVPPLDSFCPAGLVAINNHQLIVLGGETINRKSYDYPTNDD